MATAGKKKKKNSGKMQRWEGLSYVEKVTASKLSEGPGFTPKFFSNHLGAVTKYLGGRKGLPENCKTIKLLSSDQGQI